MTYRLEPNQSVSQSVEQIAATQIDDVLAKFGKGTASPAAIHETRKTIKRLRALLSLVGHGLDAQDMRREHGRLRAIAHSLAGARDSQVMIETAAKLESAGLPERGRAASRALTVLLGKNPKNGHTDLPSSVGSLPLAPLQEARDALRSLALDSLTFDDVLRGFGKTYRRGRKCHVSVFAADGDDETFHDLRKEVQQHWRHLQLLCDAWPKALRPQIALARELSETLGEDHDIAVLAAFARQNADKLGGAKGLAAYLRLCASRQQNLRRHSDLLARRLYAEKSKALQQRISVYWETAEALDRGKAGLADGGNVISIRPVSVKARRPHR